MVFGFWKQLLIVSVVLLSMRLRFKDSKMRPVNKNKRQNNNHFINKKYFSEIHKI
jgi:hypothetical protein